MRHVNFAGFTRGSCPAHRLRCTLTPSNTIQYTVSTHSPSHVHNSQIVQQRRMFNCHTGYLIKVATLCRPGENVLIKESGTSALAIGRSLEQTGSACE